MAVDNNIVGLSVEMQFNTAAAMQGFDQLSSRATALEDSVAKMSRSTLGSLAGMYKDISANLADINDYSNMGLDDLTKQLKQVDKLIDLNDEIKVFQKTEGKFWDELLKDIKEYKKFVEGKNVLHEAENDLVKAEVNLAEQLNQEGEKRKKNLKDSGVGFNDLVRAAERLVAVLMKTDDIAEHFVTANYRAYDSQNALAQQVRETSMAYGLLLDKATEAAVLAGAMGFQRDELEQYTKVIAQGARVTGRSNQAIAEHALRMKQVGFNAEQMEKHYAKLAEAQRKYKLSTDDLNKAIEGTSWSPAMQELLFGKGGAEEYTLMKAAIIGIGKEAGVAADQMSGILSGLENPETMSLLSGGADEPITDAQTFMKALKGVADEARMMKKEMEAAEAAGDKFEAQNILWQLRALGKARLNADENAVMALATLKDENWQLLENADSIEELTTLNDEFRKANQTMTMSIKILGSQIMSIIGMALEPMRETLMELADWMQTFVKETLAPNIKAFRAWWTELQNTEGWIGTVAKAIPFIIGGFMALVAVMTMAGASIMSFMTAIGSLKFLTAGLPLVGAGLKVLGEGLWSVSKAAVAFGFALLLAGGGAYLFALGVKTLSDIPYDTMKASVIALGLAMIGFAIALGIAIAIIAMTGTAIAPVLPLVFALGIALLILGGAAWLVGDAFKRAGEGIQAAGVGIYFMGKGLLLVAEANSQVGVLAWSKMAAGIWAISRAANSAAPNLLNFASAYQTLNNADVARVGQNMSVLSKALQSLLASTSKFSGMSMLGVMAGLGVIIKAAPAIGWAAVIFDKAARRMQHVPEAISGVGIAVLSLGLQLTAFITMIPALQKAADGLMLFASSIRRSGLILRLATSSFGWLSLIRLLAYLEFMSVGFQQVASSLKASVEDFNQPSNVLISTLQGLAEAVAGFDQVGDRLGENLESLITPLDKYTTQLEAASQRINDAIMTKMLPAVEAAEKAGIKDALKSEAITSVELLPPKEEDKNQLRMVALLEQQNAILQSLSETILGLGTEDVGRIKDLLEERLSQSNSNNTVPNLSSELTGWA